MSYALISAKTASQLPTRSIIRHYMGGRLIKVDRPTETWDIYNPPGESFKHVGNSLYVVEFTPGDNVCYLGQI